MPRSPGGDGEIDLVILYGQGRGGRARFAYGSVATRLLRHGCAPVLLVRADDQADACLTEQR